MLDLLVNYAHGHGLETEPGFKPKDVRWAIVCDDSGRFLDVAELGDPVQKRNRGQTFPKCPDLSQPELVTGKEMRSHFLVETAAVVALYGIDAEIGKIQAKHDHFVKLLHEAAQSVAGLEQVAGALDSPATLVEIQDRLRGLKARPTDRVTLRIGSCYPVEASDWHPWWRAFRESLRAEKGRSRDPSSQDAPERQTMRCFVSGQLIEPARTHSKIEGLASVGGQPSGDALISFDKDAFRSYGLEQSDNAAVSESAVSAYRAALNDLIRRHSQTVAGTKVVHWFQRRVPPEDDPLSWFVEGAEEEERNAQHLAHELLQSIQSGKRADLIPNRYFALTLSAYAGRVMLRDFMEGSFEELIRHVKAWFDDLAIVHRDGGRLASNPKFLAVLGATVRDLKELPPPRAAKMWRVAVRNELIPSQILAEALAQARTRILTGQPFNHAQMGLLKAYHNRQTKQEGGNPVKHELAPNLNEEHPSPAYQCGRLMALLARLQQAALGDVGSGVVQRYYAAASSTPGLVLGRLTRLSQFHIGKLAPGLAYWYESRIADVWGQLKENLPTTLSLEEQSLFALGYYQQLADLRTKKPKEETHA